MTDATNFIAPPVLPNATPEYNETAANQHNKILRLYFGKIGYIFNTELNPERLARIRSNQVLVWLEV